MNVHLKKMLDRVEAWPASAQDALVVAVSNIERTIVASSTVQRMTLVEVMQAAPMDELNLERIRTWPHVRDVKL
jgi:hypothetical protein